MHLFNSLPVLLGCIWIAHGTGLPDLEACDTMNDCASYPARCLSFLKRCPITRAELLRLYGIEFFKGFTQKVAGSRDRWYEYVGYIQEQADSGTLVVGWSWDKFFEEISNNVANDAQGYALEALAIALLNAADAKTFLEAAKKAFSPKTYMALFSLWPFVPEVKYEERKTEHTGGSRTEEKEEDLTQGVYNYRQFFQYPLQSPILKSVVQLGMIQESQLEKAKEQTVVWPADEVPPVIKKVMENSIFKQDVKDVWLQIWNFFQENQSLWQEYKDDFAAEWQSIAEYAYGLKEAMEQTFERPIGEKPLTIRTMMQNLILTEKGKDVWRRTWYFLKHEGPLLVGDSIDQHEDWERIADYTYSLKRDKGNTEGNTENKDKDKDIFSRLIFLVTRYAGKLEEQQAFLIRLYYFAKAERFCDAFYSSESRKRLTLLANLEPARIEYYNQAVKFAFTVCLDSEALDQTRLKSVESFEILGMVESFRVNELLEAKNVRSLNFMHEYAKTKAVSQETLDISEPSQLSLIFVSLEKLMDGSKMLGYRHSKLYQGLLKLFVEEKPDLFKKSVCSPAYRNLLWSILIFDRDYLQEACEISKDTCSSLIERSLQDLNTDNAQQVEAWAKTKMHNLKVFVKKEYRCDLGALYTCDSLFKPEPSKLMQLALKVTNRHSRRLIFLEITTWIPPQVLAFLEVNQLSDWFTNQARGGEVDHFKQVLQGAGRELAGTPGMMYAMLAVVHHLATDVKPFKEGAKQILHVTETMRKPTLQDLCANERCLEEEAGKRNNITALPSDLRGVQFQPPEQVDTLAMPTEPESSLLPDRFFYFLAQQCAGEDDEKPLESWKDLLKSNLGHYLKVIYSTMAIGDFNALRTNLHTCFRVGASGMPLGLAAK